ncbi:lipoprotein [Ottowia sp.]|uniref:LPS translocon maturation chaperone LptM n=1 Tax=Ottowia sp. TaxID=1898956 RepID=UPI002BAC672D|nr:lipoprotein [Ottowia sp.]HOB65372.1 lipoprotein [Ottowia sp.]HPZ58278.1 lipoprotein [Ottowia sp.]HQD46543.1 lipoprotein [Ottowia sp.]
MSFALPHRSILVTGAALMLCAGLSACGQKGPLYLPQTPAAAGRATLPQTVFGGSGTQASAPAPAAAASASLPTAPPPVLPDVPDIQ